MEIKVMVHIPDINGKQIFIEDMDTNIIKSVVKSSAGITQIEVFDVLGQVLDTYGMDKGVE